MPTRFYRHEVVGRLLRLVKRPHHSVERIGRVRFGSRGYSLYMAVAAKSDERSKENVLISAGVHGDEPAGVYAALRFLERYAYKYLDEFNFYVLPCVNPSGFENNTRANLAGTDLNRNFVPNSNVVEVRLVHAALMERPHSFFVFSMDLHENDPNFNSAEFDSMGFTKADHPSEFYLYEVCPEKEYRMGQEIVARLESAGVPICKWPKIYKDLNNEGIVWYPEGYQNAIYAEMITLEGYAFNNLAWQSFTTETPGSVWPLERRIEVQIAAITAALDIYKKRL